MIRYMSMEERINKKMKAAKSTRESERMALKFSCTRKNIKAVSAILAKNSSGIIALASVLVFLKMAAGIKTPATKLSRARKYEIPIA